MIVLMLAGRAPSLVNFRGYLLGEMVRRGHEVHAAAPGLNEDEETRAALMRIGVTAHDARLERAGFSLCEDLRYANGIRDLCRRIGADLVIGYTIKPVIWGLIGAWRAQVPSRVALITGLGYVFTGEAKGKRTLRQAAKLLYRLALSRATLVFFQNRDDKADFEADGILPRSVPTFVVDGSGVDVSHYRQMELPEGPPDGPVEFLMISRLLASKGVRDYAEAARRVRQYYPQARFRLIGRFDDNPETLPKAEIERWERDGVLTHSGEIPDVRVALATAHVFVLPSAYREGVPRVLLEALSTGRAVITTNAPGCRETVRDGMNGFLVPTYDPEALAVAMIRYIETPELIVDHGREGRVLAESRFDVPIITGEMIAQMRL